MASAAATPAPKRPLSFMEKLGPLVSVYRPPGSRRPDEGPRLIIIGSWTDARDAHVAKYIVKYQSLYPAAQILLLRSTINEIVWSSRIGPAMKAAVPVVRAISSSTGQSASPEVLIHIFSNGGSGSVANLYEQFAATAGPGERFPRHVTIFDSSPGIFSISHAVTFVNVSLSPVQRIIVAPILYAWAILWTILMGLGIIPNSLSDWGKAHNNKDSTTEAQRVYIYSPSDVIINDKGIEAHAADAKAKGFSVELEKYEGSAHVAHTRKDENRYWAIVRRTWDGAA
ncbi:hypothetical protein GQ53DRAFT_746153 [Thozetella sp. PMI_491]|nr:hypothetical protein GQ53DRAFT_746153 [Thozetella sp. PMI_491]